MEGKILKGEARGGLVQVTRKKEEQLARREQELQRRWVGCIIGTRKRGWSARAAGADVCTPWHVPCCAVDGICQMRQSLSSHPQDHRDLCGDAWMR
jgi:hypothetical protein